MVQIKCSHIHTHPIFQPSPTLSKTSLNCPKIHFFAGNHHTECPKFSVVIEANDTSSIS